MSLRDATIRLAHANPELRPHLLPLLKKARKLHWRAIIKGRPVEVEIARQKLDEEDEVLTVDGTMTLDDGDGPYQVAFRLDLVHDPEMNAIGIDRIWRAVPRLNPAGRFGDLFMEVLNKQSRDPLMDLDLP